jgi:excisionase family DNA binding protein
MARTMKTASKRAKKVANKGIREKSAATETLESPAATNGSALLSMDEAIAMLKTTRATFYRWLRAGKFQGHKAGRQWRFEKRDIERFLKGEAPRIELRADISPLIKQLRKKCDSLDAPKVEFPEETEVQQAVKLMIELCLALQASDLHMEPMRTPDSQEEKVQLRYRIDGVLHPMVDFDFRLLPAVVACWKTETCCDLKDRKPQHGQLRLLKVSDEGTVDIRVTYLPTGLGDSLVARFLVEAKKLPLLDDLPYAPEDKKKLLAAITSPWGMVICNGPTGSGKTTTMYACLQHIAGPGLKIITVEDPIEMHFPWMVQTQINEREGITLTLSARAVMRCDPDVIAIAEIRNLESMEICIQMALTGHLVMTQLHAQDASKALLRMVDVGAKPDLLCDATRLILSQRLIRRLCPKCSKPYAPEARWMERALSIAHAGGLNVDDLSKEFRKPVGCQHCKQLGFRGRTVVAEALEVSPEIAATVQRKASADEIRTLAVRLGMTTMAADGIRRAAAGEVWLEEAIGITAM